MALRRRLSALLPLALAASVLSSPFQASAQSDADWPTYHKDLTRSGVAAGPAGSAGDRPALAVAHARRRHLRRAAHGQQQRAGSHRERHGLRARPELGRRGVEHASGRAGARQRPAVRKHRSGRHHLDAGCRCRRRHAVRLRVPPAGAPRALCARPGVGLDPLPAADGPTWRQPTDASPALGAEPVAGDRLHPVRRTLRRLRRLPRLGRGGFDQRRLADRGLPGPDPTRRRNLGPLGGDDRQHGQPACRHRQRQLERSVRLRQRGHQAVARPAGARLVRAVKLGGAERSGPRSRLARADAGRTASSSRLARTASAIRWPTITWAASAARW